MTNGISFLSDCWVQGFTCLPGSRISRQYQYGVNLGLTPQLPRPIPHGVNRQSDHSTVLAQPDTLFNSVNRNQCTLPETTDTGGVKLSNIGKSHGHQILTKVPIWARKSNSPKNLTHSATTTCIPRCRTRTLEKILMGPRGNQSTYMPRIRYYDHDH